MPTSAGPARAELMLERAAEPQIGERDAMAARLERRRDVFHAERLDAEERAEPEALVAGHGTQQQDVHGQGSQRNIHAG